MDEVEDSAPGFFPQWFLDLVVDKTFEGALDWTAQAMAPFTPQSFFDELHGLSEGSGTDYDLLLRIHMLPEATKGHCSMFGAAKSATPDGGLVQLRALDWDVDGPFKDYPQVTIYHPEDDTTNAWANVAFTGFIGTITGMNDKSLAISEIGVTFPDESFGKER